jgi:hypothetical protein
MPLDWLKHGTVADEAPFTVTTAPVSEAPDAAMSVSRMAVGDGQGG